MNQNLFLEKKKPYHSLQEKFRLNREKRFRAYDSPPLTGDHILVRQVRRDNVEFLVVKSQDRSGYV